MPAPKHLRNILLALAALTVSLPAIAQDLIQDVLALEEPPPGIIFEVVGSDRNALQWAVPRVRDYAQRLRARFPNLHVAVVSHGQEQFALMSAKRSEFTALHDMVQQMTEGEDIQLHVCETYAGWKGVGAEEFPDYVDVAAAGPAQINDYRKLGYVHILLKK